eukprot:scaffold7740_cov112-Isochrysis_galbana.AAC.6
MMPMYSPRRGSGRHRAASPSNVNARCTVKRFSAVFVEGHSQWRHGLRVFTLRCQQMLLHDDSSGGGCGALLTRITKRRSFCARLSAMMTGCMWKWASKYRARSSGSLSRTPS